MKAAATGVAAVTLGNYAVIYMVCATPGDSLIRFFPGFFLQLGARRTHMDKSVWVWKHGADMMYLSSHVDDVLVSYSSEAIRARFDDALRTFFGKMPNGEDRVTGGDSEVREYLGIAVERDRVKKTITLHQCPFIRKLLDSFNSHRLRQGRSAPLDDNLPL